MEEEKNRSEIDSQYKWNLSSIFKNEQEVEDAFLEVKEILNKLIKYKGHIMDNGKNLLEFLLLNNKANMIIEDLYVYNICGKYQMEMTNSNYQKSMKKTKDFTHSFYEQLSFIDNEILKGDYKKLLSEEKGLLQYETYLENIDRYKPHTLSDKEEEILAKISNVLGSGEDTFENLLYSDANFGEIKDENGKVVTVNNINYSSLIRSKDRDTRKRAYEKRNEYYKDFRNTLTNAFFQTVKESIFESKIRNFDTPLAMDLFNDDMPKEVFDNLINVISNNAEYINKYYEIKRRLLGLEKLYSYDFSIMPELNISNEVKYDDAIEKIRASLKVMGKDYCNALDKYLNNNLIDAFSSKGKVDGGYQIGTYRKGPFIAYNYNGSYSDFYGLIHEIGHAMHKHYANKKQPYIYANYGLFIAETASLTNEVLLTDYLLKKATGKNEKIFYLMKQIEEIDHYLFNIVKVVEHEHEVYKRELEGNPMSVDEVCELHKELTDKYYSSKNVEILEQNKYSWMLHSQYHQPYYFYKYAIGMVVALIIGKRIADGDEEFREKYFEFLSSGSSKKPFELYRDLGIDLSSPETYKSAINYFNSQVSLLEDLINE